MSSDRLVGLLLPLAFLAAFLGIPFMLWRERANPTSYSRRGVPVEVGGEPSLEVWRGMSTDQQEAHDTAVLDMAEQAELDAEDDAQEAAQFLAAQVRVNAQYHP